MASGRRNIKIPYIPVIQEPCTRAVINNTTALRAPQDACAAALIRTYDREPFTSCAGKKTKDEHVVHKLETKQLFSSPLCLTTHFMNCTRARELCNRYRSRAAAYPGMHYFPSICSHILHWLRAASSPPKTQLTLITSENPSLTWGSS